MKSSMKLYSLGVLLTGGISTVHCNSCNIYKYLQPAKDAYIEKIRSAEFSGKIKQGFREDRMMMFTCLRLRN